jgi:hypothetical protein
MAFIWGLLSRIGPLPGGDASSDGVANPVFTIPRRSGTADEIFNRASPVEPARWQAQIAAMPGRDRSAFGLP